MTWFVHTTAKHIVSLSHQFNLSSEQKLLYHHTPHRCCCCTGNGNWNLRGHRDHGCKLVIYEPLRAIKWIYNALYAKHHPFSTKNKKTASCFAFLSHRHTCMMREKHAWSSKGSSYFCCLVRWDDATAAAEWNLFTGRGHLLSLACDNTQRNWLFLSKKEIKNYSTAWTDMSCLTWASLEPGRLFFCSSE